MKLKGHDDESAHRICGKLQKEIEGARLQQGATTTTTATPFEDKSGRLFLKVFLLDGSVNLNSWGVYPGSIERNIYSAIGKPIVMYKNGNGEWDHPPIHGQDSLDHALAFQDLYKIGTYIDIVQSPTKQGEWWGIAEITDDGVKKAIREDPKIPFYVSPTIRLTQPLQNEHALTDWSFMHSAIVDRPAYTVKKAYISGQCSGSTDTCLLQLRKASISANNGDVGCGFCTYKAAKEIQQKTISSLSANREHLLIEQKIMNDDNTNRGVSTSSAVEVTSEENRSNANNNQQNQQQPQQKEVSTTSTTSKVVKQQENVGGGNADKEEEEQQQKNSNNKTATTITSNNPKDLLEAVQRLSTKNKDLELQLQTAKADKESLQALNAQFNDRLAKLEQEREEERLISRKAAITDRIQKSPLYQNVPQEEKQRQIENFVNGTTTLEQLDGMLIPLEASFRKASLGGYASASYTPRLSLGGANNSKSVATVGEVKSAKVTTSAVAGDNNEQLPAHLRLHQYFGSNKANTGGGIE